MPATLSSLRDRIRNQLQAAGGRTEPLVVTPSGATLAAILSRVETALQDTTNARWSDADLTEAIRRAVEHYSFYSPNQAIATINITQTGREISLGSITGLTRVDKVWWDYDSATPGYPPNWRQFEVWPGGILYIDDESQPTNGDVVRVWYTKPHTLLDLDGAPGTTIPNEDITHIITGAVHFAAQQRVAELTELMTIDRETVKELERIADEAGRSFRYSSRAQLPAWQRRAFAYNQDDIDEAIRWALHRYTEVKPDRAITTVTLTSTSREISLSSISNLLNVERVWTGYTALDPVYPVKWEDFELWPGNILYVKSSEEPANGEKVRIWYTKPHTLNGLDSATTTTISADDETLIVTGASGFCAQERLHEKETVFGSTNLREWAEARLREFERGLRAIAKRQAARHSGIATAADLDRWDTDTDGWA